MGVSGVGSISVAGFCIGGRGYFGVGVGGFMLRFRCSGVFEFSGVEWFEIKDTSVLLKILICGDVDALGDLSSVVL